MRNLLATALLILLSHVCYADFGIYTANLDGTDQKTILVSKTHQMSHPKVSADWKYIVFTRYNNKGADNLAEEMDGYENTEICIATVNGESAETLIPAIPGVINFNASWSSNGILFVSSQNPKGIPWGMEYSLKVRRLRRLPTPLDQIILDPSEHKGDFVYSSIGASNGIWSLKGDVAKQLTMSTTLDSDPQMAPDSKNMVFLRAFGGDFHIMRYNFTSTKTTDISKNKGDSAACWSSDSKTLVFPHLNLKDLSQSGLYKMNPDGYNREQLPLKRGYFYTHPSFFPGSNSKIIYAGFDIKGLP